VGHHGQGVAGDTAVVGEVGVGPAPKKSLARGWARPGRVRSTGRLRSMVREMLAEELGEIDEWVEPLLHAGER
jgi:hypothetical protein